MNLNDFQEFFVEHQKNYNVDESNRLPVLALRLAGETGEATELIKKYLRDGKIDVQHYAKELGDIMAYLAILAHYFGFTLEEIAEMVIAKNKARIVNGSLHGSGDNR